MTFHLSFFLSWTTACIERLELMILQATISYRACYTPTGAWFRTLSGFYLESGLATCMFNVALSGHTTQTAIL